MAQLRPYRNSKKSYRLPFWTTRVKLNNWENGWLTKLALFTQRSRVQSIRRLMARNHSWTSLSIYHYISKIGLLDITVSTFAQGMRLRLFLIVRLRKLRRRSWEKWRLWLSITRKLHRRMWRWKPLRLHMQLSFSFSQKKWLFNESIHSQIYL